MSHSFATPWTVGRKAPLSVGFPRQKYWNRLPFPPPRICLTQESNSHLLSPALAGGFLTASATRKALRQCKRYENHCLCVNWSFAFREFFSKYFQSVVGWFRRCETWGYGMPTVRNTASGTMQFLKNNKYNISHVPYRQEACILVVGTRQNRWNDLKIKQCIMKH